jgi:hypothetical protein
VDAMKFQRRLLPSDVGETMRSGSKERVGQERKQEVVDVYIGFVLRSCDNNLPRSPHTIHHSTACDRGEYVCCLLKTVLRSAWFTA